MTEKEKRRLLEKAAKLRPKPVLLPSGSWRCQVMVAGVRQSVVADTPEEANALALALREGLVEKAAQKEEESRENITLSDAIDRYIERRKNVLSPSTITGYREIQRNRFKSLMEKKVKQIDHIALQSAVNDEAANVSAKTVKNALGLVLAVTSEYHDVNVKRIRLPQRKRSEHKYLEEQDMIELFDAIRGDIAEIPILLAMWLGMRRSEIMGLCWDSIDFENKRIIVQRTYVKGPDAGYILRDEMKTEASRRVLACPDYILAKLAAYTPEHRDGRVFQLHPNTIYCNMKDICEKNGIPFVGVHGLRHTNASVMLSLGIIDRVAMARGGWSTDVTMKQVYQHTFSTDKASAGEKIDNFFQSIAAGKIAHEIAHEK